MAVDYSVRVDCDQSEIGASKVTDLTRELLAAIQNAGTRTTIYNKTYTVGSPAAAENLMVQVSAGGASTADWGFRVMFDAATVSKDTKIATQRAIEAVISKYTVDTITTAAAYSSGTGEAFNLEVTIT